MMFSIPPRGAPVVSPITASFWSADSQFLLKDFQPRPIVRVRVNAAGAKGRGGLPQRLGNGRLVQHRLIELLHKCARANRAEVPIAGHHLTRSGSQKLTHEALRIARPV